MTEKLRTHPEDNPKNRAEVLKEKYPAGVRVMLEATKDIGTVLDANDVGLLLIQWDTGNTLDVIDVEECVIIQ